MDILILTLGLLSTEDLCRVSQTCKGLRTAVLKINRLKCADVSGGLENVPIPVRVSTNR